MLLTTLFSRRALFSKMLRGGGVTVLLKLLLHFRTNSWFSLALFQTLQPTMNTFFSDYTLP